MQPKENKSPWWKCTDSTIQTYQWKDYTAQLRWCGNFVVFKNNERLGVASTLSEAWEKYVAHEIFYEKEGHKMKQLPTKMSELIRIAVADLEKAEKSPLYKVEMGLWHMPVKNDETTDEKICAVCLAGAVMANTLGANPKFQADPHRFGHTNKYLLCVLDRVRRYMWLSAVDFMHLLDVDMPTFIGPEFGENAVHYEENPELFKANMLAAADYYEAKGY